MSYPVQIFEIDDFSLACYHVKVIVRFRMLSWYTTMASFCFSCRFLLTACRSRRVGSKYDPGVASAGKNGIKRAEVSFASRDGQTATI